LRLLNELVETGDYGGDIDLSGFLGHRD
jgi:hypothetical protein